MKTPLEISTQDYPAFYSGYVNHVLEAYGNDPWPAMKVQAEELPDWLADIPTDKHTYQYEEGKWSVKQVIGHLIDGERIFGIRCLHFARQESQSLIGFDENHYVTAANFDDRPWQSLLAEFRLARLSNLAMFEGFEDAWWEQKGTANGSEFKLAAMPFIMVGHVMHHFSILKSRYGI